MCKIAMDMDLKQEQMVKELGADPTPSEINADFPIILMGIRAGPR